MKLVCYWLNWCSDFNRVVFVDYLLALNMNIIMNQTVSFSSGSDEVQNFPILVINAHRNLQAYLFIIIDITVGDDILILLKHFSSDTDDISMILMLFLLDIDCWCTVNPKQSEKCRNFQFTLNFVMVDKIYTTATQYAHCIIWRSTHNYNYLIRHIGAFVTARIAIHCNYVIQLLIVVFFCNECFFSKLCLCNRW